MMSAMSAADGHGARISVLRQGVDLVVELGGRWSLHEGLPPVDGVREALEGGPLRVRLEPSGLERWDTSLLVAVRRIEAACAERGVEVDLAALPAAARRLLELAAAPPGSVEARKAGERELIDALERLRRASPLADRVGVALLESLEFLGRASSALGRTLAGRNRRLDLDLGPALHEASVGVLPVLALIALLGGGVLSLLATQQLDKLGAVLLAPNLVAIVIVRELSALATGLAMAGRWASANAADLGAMVAGEEVEALRAMGVDPFDLLVAPRLLALLLMGPLLVLYATAFGLLGSVVVGVALVDLPAADYLERTRAALGYDHAVAGLVKGATFGLVVGLAGCYHGLRSGRGQAAIGGAVKAAVVTAIVWVVITDAAITAFLKWIRY